MLKKLHTSTVNFSWVASNVDSLCTNIPLEETINICTNLLHNNEYVIEGIKKTEFKNLVLLAAKQSYSFLKMFFINKRMAWTWDRLLDPLWQMFSYHFMKSNG